MILAQASHTCTTALQSIGQPKALSTLLISCDIKSLNSCGYNNMVTWQNLVIVDIWWYLFCGLLQYDSQLICLQHVAVTTEGWSISTIRFLYAVVLCHCLSRVWSEEDQATKTSFGKYIKHTFVVHLNLCRKEFKSTLQHLEKVTNWITKVNTKHHLTILNTLHFKKRTILG